MRHRFPSAIAACLLLAAPLQAAEIGLRPEQIGEIFCLSRTGNDMAPAEALLTAPLAGAIAAAWARNDAWAAGNPGDKPPLGDGIPWQAWPDYASECRPGLVTLMRSDARVEIAYAFSDAPEAGFVDTLVLRRVALDTRFGGEGWRIDNVLHATGDDLRSALEESFAGL